MLRMFRARPKGTYEMSRFIKRSKPADVDVGNSSVLTSSTILNKEKEEPFSNDGGNRSAQRKPPNKVTGSFLTCLKQDPL